jgi:hypothetical protein
VALGACEPEWCLFFLLVLAMGLAKGGSYGTFEGQEGFPQPSAPSLAGTYSSGGQQQFASYAIPGMYAIIIPPALSSASQILRLRIAVFGECVSKSGNVDMCGDFLSKIQDATSV